MKAVVDNSNNMGDNSVQATSTYVDIHTHHPRCGVLSPVMAGIHPWDATKGCELPDLAACNIVGETGLDFACEVDREAQRRLFEWHLCEAERLRKPIVLHVAKSFEEVISMLAKHKIEGVVFHGFIGSAEQAVRAIDRGYYLSFGERSLRSPKSRRVAEQIPLDRLFCETDDNPDITIEQIYKSIASLRGIDVKELSEQLIQNYNRVIHRA